jgi:uncharacterized cupin superfamily protein
VLHRASGAAVATTFRRAGFGRSDPFARQRDIAWEGPELIAAGRATFIGEIDVPSYPHDEVLVVVEGELGLATDGASLAIGPGEGAVIARGTRVRIHAGSRVRFVWCAAQGTDSMRGGIVPLRSDADFKPSAPPPTETLLGPVPQCRSDNVFTDDDARFRAGTWDSTAYHRIVRPHPVNEFMYLLAGTVHFAGVDGSVITANAGDAVFVPRDTAVGWESSERVAKFYGIQKVNA